MPVHREAQRDQSDDAIEYRPQFARTGEVAAVPRYHLPQGSMTPETAYQIVHDELMLDGNARLNVATFVTTWMEPAADVLMAECADKNMIDKDEYPQTAELEMRCVNMIANLWGSQASAGQATGCSTTGSSEACMLGGMALLWRWRARRQAAGLDTARPNMVMGSNVQVCWEKFCRYWDVEPRLVPVGGGATHLTADRAVAACDENTIGVVAIMGSTFDGTYEPVGEIAAGAIVGDADVLGRHPYRCRVEARTPVTAWQIDAADLDRLLVDAPTFARALARDLGRRLRAAELSLATG